MPDPGHCAHALWKCPIPEKPSSSSVVHKIPVSSTKLCVMRAIRRIQMRNSSMNPKSHLVCNVHPHKHLRRDTPQRANTPLRKIRDFLSFAKMLRKCASIRHSWSFVSVPRFLSCLPPTEHYLRRISAHLRGNGHRVSIIPPSPAPPEKMQPHSNQRLPRIDHTKCHPSFCAFTPYVFFAAQRVKKSPAATTPAFRVEHPSPPGRYKP